MIMSIGRVCVKVKGRDSGNYCVVVDKSGYSVVIEGKNIKRSKCNVRHLEPLPFVLEVQRNTEREVLLKEMSKIGLD